MILTIPPQVRRVLDSLDLVRDEREVVKAEEARQYLVSLPPGQPITEWLIGDLHRILTEGFDYYGNFPGVYRGEGEMELVGGPMSGVWLAPDYTRVPMLVRRLVGWQKWPPDCDPVTCALMVHFHLLEIHPFADGNGRVARALEAFLLHQAGVLPIGFWALANYYYRHRDEYIFWLDYGRSGGGLDSFLTFGRRALASEQERIKRILDLWPERYGDKLVLGDDVIREALRELGE